MVKSGQIRYWTPAKIFKSDNENRFNEDRLIVVLGIMKNCIVVYKFVTSSEKTVRVADIDVFEAMTDVYF